MTVEVHTARWPSGEVATIGAVGVAHFMSHLLQLAFAPLFLMMRGDLGVSFTQLGLILSVFYLCSGVGQVTAGVLVDRFGADRVLLAGLALHGGATAAMGIAPRYEMLLPLAALAGLGNAVYHPANLSILSHRVAAERLGRAFAAHVIFGNFGFAASPLLSGAIGIAFGWRAALIALGLSAVAVGVVLAIVRPVLQGAGGRSTAPGRRAQEAPAVALSFRDVLAMPVVLVAFLYFFLTAVALSGVQNFSIVALQEGFGVSVGLAALSITLYQLGSAFGVGVGGYVADRAENHHQIAMGGLAIASLLALVTAAGGVPPAVTVGFIAAIGLTVGITMPSRDVLVRRVAPKGATGKVFGVVYSGYDIGGLLGPLAYGLILDHHMPRLVYLAAALPLALAVATAFGVRKRPAD